MSILSTLSALQGPVVLLLVIVGPSTVPRILNSILRIRRRRLQPASPKLPPRPPLALPAKALVALHIIYRLYSLIQPPFNVFTTYNLPLFASNDSLRQRLLPFVSATPGDLSFSPSKTSVERSEIEHLLLKLTSLDNRLLYARFGHEPLLRCGWCASVEDYGVAAAPRTAAAYALTAVMLGIVGLSVVSGPTAVARKRAWRGAISWVVGLGVIADMGARWAWNLRVVDGDTLQLDAYIHTLRTLSLLLLPIIYVLLPLPSSSAPTLAALLPSLANTTSTLRLTSLARSAANRDPATRAIAERAALEGDQERLRLTARRDEHVIAAMGHVGMTEEALRASARQWVEEGWGGLVHVSSNV